jgi:hypothetical protein
MLAEDIRVEASAASRERRFARESTLARLQRDASQRAEQRCVEKTSSLHASLASASKAWPEGLRREGGARNGPRAEPLIDPPKRAPNVDAPFSPSSTAPQHAIAEAAAPKHTFQEVLYREGMVTRQERARWREAAQALLLEKENEQCTFQPALNAQSARLVAQARSSEAAKAPRLGHRLERIVPSDAPERRSHGDDVATVQMGNFERPLAVQLTARPPSAASADEFLRRSERLHAEQRARLQKVRAARAESAHPRPPIPAHSGARPPLALPSPFHGLPIRQ